MGFSLRMGFEKKISRREACHKSNKIDVSMYLSARVTLPQPLSRLLTLKLYIQFEIFGRGAKHASKKL